MSDMNYALGAFAIIIFMIVVSSKFVSFDEKIKNMNAKFEQQEKRIEELKDQNTYQDMIINKLNAEYNLKNGIK